MHHLNTELDVFYSRPTDWSNDARCALKTDRISSHEAFAKSTFLIFRKLKIEFFLSNPVRKHVGDKIENVESRRFQADFTRRIQIRFPDPNHRVRHDRSVPGELIGNVYVSWPRKNRRFQPPQYTHFRVAGSGTAIRGRRASHRINFNKTCSCWPRTRVPFVAFSSSARRSAPRLRDPRPSRRVPKINSISTERYGVKHIRGGYESETRGRRRG